MTSTLHSRRHLRRKISFCTSARVGVSIAVLEKTFVAWVKTLSDTYPDSLIIIDDSACKKSEYQGFSLGGKGGRCVGFLHSCADFLKILGALASWSPQELSRPVHEEIYLSLCLSPPPPPLSPSVPGGPPHWLYGPWRTLAFFRINSFTFTLINETLHSPKTIVNMYQTTWRHVPGHSYLKFLPWSLPGCAVLCSVSVVTGRNCTVRTTSAEEFNTQEMYKARICYQQFALCSCSALL